MKNKLSLVNFLILIGIVGYLFWDSSNNKIHKEIKAERISIVGPDGNLFISISNPQKQALATQNGIQLVPDQKNRDLPGIIFFNRVGDEVGSITFDGTDSTSSQGITFDQLKNDQVMAIMKDEYYEGKELKRWYGMFLRERSDSIRREEYVKNAIAEINAIKDESKKQELLSYYNNKLNSEIDIFRMFLGREENRDVGLFLYDSKGRERIKLFIDKDDNAQIQIIDTNGNAKNLIDK
ncbi:hypothetical protein EMN47_15930 [Prolixibacteraceae bacterium JC049]|nr:hypothetical protein [Prolixibacteraceae bacterium JC049]